MSTKFIEKVAVVGAGGRIGGIFAKGLVESGKQNVIALVRAESKSKLPDGVKRVTVDFGNEASLVQALQGQEFLIITLAVTVPEEVHARIVTAAAKAGVPYVVPNVFSYPITPELIQPSDQFSHVLLGRINNVKDTGVSSPIVLSCGYWYQWSLALGEYWFGIDIGARTVTFIDDGKRAITVSTWDQCGRSFAALLSLPESGTSPSVADYKTKGVNISSFTISQRDMLDSLNRVLGTTDADWKITYESISRRIQGGLEEMKQGNADGFGKVIYANVFSRNNKHSDYAVTDRSDNDVLGLPKEDLDEATKIAVEWVKTGTKSVIGR